MSRVSVTIGAPTRENSSEVAWIYSRGSYKLVGTAGSSPLFQNSIVDYYLTALNFQNLNQTLNFTSNISSDISGLDLSFAWESNITNAITLQAGSFSLVLPGPNVRGSGASVDPSEPYIWRPTTSRRTQLAAELTEYRALSSSIKANTVLILNDNDAPIPAGQRIYAVTTSNPAKVLSVNLVNPGASILEGSLPSGLTNPAAVAGHQGDRSLYFIANGRLWRQSIDNLSSTDSPNGNLGVIPQFAAGGNGGLTVGNDGNLYGLDSSRYYHRIDRNNPANSTRLFRLGSSPQGQSYYVGLYSVGNNNFALDPRGSIVRIVEGGTSNRNYIEQGRIQSLTGLGRWDTGGSVVFGNRLYTANSFNEIISNFVSEIRDNSTADSTQLGEIGTIREGGAGSVTGLTVLDPDPFVRAEVEFNLGLDARIIRAEAQNISPPRLRATVVFDTGIGQALISRSDAELRSPPVLESQVEFNIGLDARIAVADAELFGGRLEAEADFSVGLDASIQARAELIDYPDDRTKYALDYDEETGLYRTTTGQNKLTQSALDNWSPEPQIHSIMSITLKDGTELHIWTGKPDLIIDNVTYIAEKIISASGRISKSVDRPRGINVSLDVSTDTYLDIFKRPIGYALCSIQNIVSEDGGITWSKIGHGIKGQMTNATLTGGIFNCTISPRTPVSDRARTRYWSHEDRVRLVGPQDRGMAQMKQLAGDGILGIWPLPRNRD